MPASKSSSRTGRKAKSSRAGATRATKARPSRTRTASRKAPSKRRAAPARTRKAPAKRRAGTARGKARTQSRSRQSSALLRMAKKAGDFAVAQIVPGDATELLEQDHREVESLFEQFEGLEDNSEKSKIAARICLALTVHAQIEEELVYPAARREIDKTDLVDEAEVEHASAKQLIAEIGSMTPRDDLFDAKVKVLGEYVKHHVREEENELFPKMREAGLDFYELGRKLAARKTALLIQAKESTGRR